jgi:hypothetical protein
MIRLTSTERCHTHLRSRLDGDGARGGLALALEVGERLLAVPVLHLVGLDLHVVRLVVVGQGRDRLDLKGAGAAWRGSSVRSRW